MRFLDLGKVCVGLSRTWSGLLRDPTCVTRAHVEAFQAWMIDTRSASTALNKHKSLQQFFTWLMLDKEFIDRSPMERVHQPTPQKPVPVMREEDSARLLAAI